jgi:hypothetical protein
VAGAVDVSSSLGAVAHLLQAIAGYDPLLEQDRDQPEDVFAASGYNGDGSLKEKVELGF